MDNELLYIEALLPLHLNSVQKKTIIYLFILKRLILEKQMIIQYDVSRVAIKYRYYPN